VRPAAPEAAGGCGSQLAGPGLPGPAWALPDGRGRPQTRPRARTTRSTATRTGRSLSSWTSRCRTGSSRRRAPHDDARRARSTGVRSGGSPEPWRRGDAGARASEPGCLGAWMRLAGCGPGGGRAMRGTSRPVRARAGPEERAGQAGAAGGLRHPAAAGRGRLVPVPHAEVPRPQQCRTGDARHLLPARARARAPACGCAHGAAALDGTQAVWGAEALPVMWAALGLPWREIPGAGLRGAPRARPRGTGPPGRPAAAARGRRRRRPPARAGPSLR